MTTRLPCAVPLTTREIASSGTAGDYTTDTILINCMVEKTPEGRLFVTKRPALVQFYTYNSGGATTPQGLVNYKDTILFAVGNNTVYNASSTAINVSASGSAWTATTTPPWTNRHFYGCVVFNGQIFVVGGIDSTGFIFLNDVWSSADGVNWTQVVAAAPWGPLYDHQVAVLGNTMYVMGGIINGAQTNNVWSSQDGANWTLVGTAPWVARSGHSCVSFNQGIFVMGGINAAGGYLNDVWFTPDGTTWTQMTSVASWSARQHSGHVVYNGFIWIFGGFNGATLATVYKSSDGITWTNTGSMPTPRYSPAVCVYGGGMYLLGGWNAAATTTVWSTTDGTTFTVATAAYGGAATFGGALVSFRVPSSVNALQPYTMYYIGGSPLQASYVATLNGALWASFALPNPGSSSDPCQFETQNAGDYLIIKNTASAWVFWAGTIQEITSTNYPQSTVSGIVNLDDTIYVMDINGVIYGSNLSTPFIWSALNFITADFVSDQGVCLVKYLQYVLALKSTSFQIFYDAGTFPGSPLLPLLNANTKVGCAAAGSVVKMMNTVVFMAQSGPQGRYIVVMDGYTAKQVSTPDINRILNGWDSTGTSYSWAAKFNGHDVYMLTLISATSNQLSLMYDFTSDWWYVWTDCIANGEGVFPGVNYAYFTQADFIQDRTNGIVYVASTITYGDNIFNPFNCSGLLSKIDGSDNHRKFCTSLAVISDQKAVQSPNNVTISVSDDDNQTFTQVGVYDMTVAYNPITRLGSFFRRTHKFLHADPANPMRLEALEVEIATPKQPGE